MTQESKAAATSRKKTPAPACQARQPLEHGNGTCLYAISGRRSARAAGQIRKGHRRFREGVARRAARDRRALQDVHQYLPRQLDSQGLEFRTPGERYDYAVSQINEGDFEEAANQLKGFLADTPNADFAYYGLALLYSITGKTQDCLDSLSQAIELNPKNRLQARSDNDFQSMVDDPRFTELLYPELP